MLIALAILVTLSTAAIALCLPRPGGVKVHILLDWLGLRGVLSWYHLGRLDNRTHRKLLVIDGRIGFTGGVGVGNEWTGDAQGTAHWQ